jgi:tripartite motif-containing protein 71
VGSFSDAFASHGGNAPRRLRWLVVFVLMLSAISAVPVLAADAPSGSPADVATLPSSSEETPPLPDGQDIREASEAEEREEAERERWLQSPEATQERKESRLAFAGIGAEEAKELLPTLFAAQFAGLNADPARFLSDAQLLRPLGEDETAATVSDDGYTTLMEAGIPVRAEDETGELRKVDLGLEAKEGGFETRNAHSDVYVPDSAAEPIEVGEDGLSIAQVGAGESHTAQLLGDENAYYHDVLEDTGMIVSPIAGGVELFNVLYSEESPETLRYDLELPEGATLRSTSTGGAEIVRDGKVIALVPFPTAVDAQGTEVPVQMTIDGTSLSLNVAHRDEDYALPILVDPIVENWGTAWYFGTNLKAIDYWKYDTNDWPEEYFLKSRKCISADLCSPSNAGLFITSVPDNLPANVWGHWYYYAPGSTTFIPSIYPAYSAHLNPFWRHNHGCNWENHPRPYDYHGSFDANKNWLWFETNRSMVDGTATMYTKAKGIAFGMSTGSGGSMPCWRSLMLGGTVINLDDPEVPSWVSKPTVADQWIDKTAIPVSGSASDPGLGMKYFKLWTTDGSGKALAEIGSTTHSCSGVATDPCPSSWASQITNYNPSNLPNGINGMVVFAYDALGTSHNSQGLPVFLKVDHSAPTISYSGDLLSANPIKYHLDITGTDGNSGSLATAQSGMKSLAFYFDGQLAGRYPPGVENPPACKNVQQGIDLGSCQFNKVELDLARNVSGKHTLKIVATDSLNHPSEKSIELNLPKDVTVPTVNASGPLYTTGGSWVTSAESSVDIEASDIETGVTEATLYIDGKQVGQPVKQECFYGGCLLKKTFTASLAGYSEGAHSLKLTAKDAAGNVGERSWSVKVDPGGPALDPILAPEVPEGWTPQLENFTLKYSAKDGGSGMKRVEVIRPSSSGGTIKSTPYSSACTGGESAPCPASIEGSTSISTTAMAQGAATVTVKAYDAVGQVSNTQTLTVYIDRSAPTIAASGPLISANSTTLVGLSNELDLTIQDIGSGVASIELFLDEELQQTLSSEEITESGGSQTCTGETCELKYSFAPVVGEALTPGPHVFSLVARDEAEHSDVVSNEVTLDTRPPTVDLGGPLVNAVGETLEVQTATLEASVDDGEGDYASGIADVEVSVDGVPIDPQVDVWAVDKNNNRIQGFSDQGEFLTAFGSSGAGNGQLSGPAAIALDAEGDIWVAERGNHRVQEFNENGQYLSKFGSQGSGNGQFSGYGPRDLAIDAEGDIWVSDYSGRVQEFNGNGEFIQSVGSSGSGPGQFGESAGIGIGEGKVWVGDWTKHRVSVFSETGEYLFNFGSSGTGPGQFSHPDAIEVDPKGNVWIGDEGNSRVQQFNQAGEYITEFGSAGTGAGQFKFAWPFGLDADDGGSIWIADASNSRIHRWQAPSDIPAPTPTYSASFGSFGTGDGQLNHPGDAAVDAKGNIWVVDENNHRIQKYASDGKYLAKFGTKGSANGQFTRPTAIAIAKGNLWVTDAGNYRVQKFSEAGTYLSQFGSSGTGNGQFSGGGPEGIAIDPKGNIWVSDGAGGRVEKFNEKGEFIAVVGAAEIGEPTGIDFGPGGTLWVADWSSNRVEVFSEDGKFVGQFGSSGSGDGQFQNPDAIDVDSKGNVWVGDQNNHRIQRFDQEGKYISQFGSKGSGEAQFTLSWPMGIATDGKGRIYITDTNNNRIQRWTIPDYAPAFSTVFGSLGSGNGQFNHSADVAIVADDCSGEEGCPQQASESYSYDQNVWGSGMHTVVVTAIDAAGNSTSEEVRVNESLSAIGPECPSASTETVNGGQVLTASAAISAIKGSMPTAVEPSEPFGGESETTAEALAPEVTRDPDGVSLNEQGIDVVGSLMGGGVEDVASGSFTVAQAVCLQPLEGAANASPPTMVDDAAVVYPNALPDTDTVIRPTALGTTIIEYLRGKEAPSSFSWVVDLQPDEELVKLENGDIAVLAPGGPEAEPAEVPTTPEGGLKGLNDVSDQITQAEHDLAVANNEVDGEVRAVLASPEVVLASEEIVSGILRISGGSVITAELPPNTVSEAEALIIKANPPAELEDICASAMSEYPEYYHVVCKREGRQPGEVSDSGGDTLDLLDAMHKAPVGLRSMIQQADQHYFELLGGSVGNVFDEWNNMSEEAKKLCLAELIRCRHVLGTDARRAAEIEDRVFNVPSGSWDTKANAFRHAFWTLQMEVSQDYDGFGISFAKAYEGRDYEDPDHPVRRKAAQMDVMNDWVGFYNGNENPTTALSACNDRLSKISSSIDVGPNVNPFRWAERNNWQLERYVYRKGRDLGRGIATGRVVIRNGRTCPEVW